MSLAGLRSVSLEMLVSSYGNVAQFPLSTGDKNGIVVALWGKGSAIDQKFQSAVEKVAPVETA